MLNAELLTDFGKWEWEYEVGHSCKIGNMRCPGTLKNQNPQFEGKKIFVFAFLCFYIPSKEEKIMGHLI